MGKDTKDTEFSNEFTPAENDNKGSFSMTDIRSRLQVPEFATKYVDAATGRDWRGTLRSWEDFASAPAADEKSGRQLPAFNAPSSPQLKNRVIRNISYFVTNYVLVYAVLTIYGIVSDLTNLVIAGIMGVLWYYVVVIFPTTEAPIVGGLKITQEHLYKISMLASVIIGFFLLGEIFNWVLTIGSIFCLLHAVFRVPTYNDRDRKSKITDEEEALGSAIELDDADNL